MVKNSRYITKHIGYLRASIIDWQIRFGKRKKGRKMSKEEFREALLKAREEFEK